MDYGHVLVSEKLVSNLILIYNKSASSTLDEEKNGYVASDQLLYALKLSAGLMPGVPDKPPAEGAQSTIFWPISGY